MPLSISQFGTEVPGCDYVLRPGSYGVICRGGYVAIVITPRGTSLPGGGRDAGESDEAALVREAAEECGLHIRVTGRIGLADELVFDEEERCYYRKRCTFFAAELTEQAQTVATEPHHQLAWLPIAEAISRLRHESQKWALMKERDEAN
jgi:8-oxo-dGTP diphosphatase